MRILTVKEVASLLQTKPTTIYTWARIGAIPALKLNGLVRFDLDEIEAWVMSNREKKVDLPVKNIPTRNQDVMAIARKAIDGVTHKRYNPVTGNQADIKVPEGRNNGTV